MTKFFLCLERRIKLNVAVIAYMVQYALTAVGVTNDALVSPETVTQKVPVVTFNRVLFFTEWDFTNQHQA